MGFTSLSGDWYESINGGMTFQFRLRALVSDNFYLGGSFERQTMDLDDAMDRLTGYDLDWEAHINEFYFLSGWMTNPRSPKSPLAFAEFGIGVAAHSASAEDPQGTVDFGSIYDDSLLSVLTGVGAIIPVSRNVGVDFMIDLRLTGKDQSSGYLLGIHAGLVALLGR